MNLHIIQHDTVTFCLTSCIVYQMDTTTVCYWLPEMGYLLLFLSERGCFFFFREGVDRKFDFFFILHEGKAINQLKRFLCLVPKDQYFTCANDN